MIAQTTAQRSSPSQRRPIRLDPVARSRDALGTKLRYVDHPSFKDPAAREAILAPSTAGPDDQASRPVLPLECIPFVAERSGRQFLSREQEYHLFRKMNYLKWRADRLHAQLDADRPSLGDLNEIEWLQSEAGAVKNRIVENYVWLVVSIAKKRVVAGYDLAERISDGNLALVQAVDGFDFARGFRFSTYVTWAVRNRLWENERGHARRRCRQHALHEELVVPPTPGAAEHESEEAQARRRSVVRRWLERLGEREQRILASRYGLDGAHGQTLKQIGEELGITKERVRQIVARAHAKLRKFASLEALEPSEIC